MAVPNPKIVRVDRDDQRRRQWFFRKLAGVRNGWNKNAISYNRSDKSYRVQAPGGGGTVTPPAGGVGPAVQPILADLETARTNVILNSAPTDTLAQNALTAAITKLNALKGEDVSAIVAKCNSAKANITLLTGPGDAAALVDIADAKALTSAL
jgi:hypothetical protein